MERQLTRYRTPTADLGLFLVAAVCTAAILTVGSLRDGILRPALGVRDPTTVVVLSTMLSSEEFQHLSQNRRSLSGVAAYRARRVRAESGGATTSATAVLVTGDFFPLLGIRANRGRLIDAADASEQKSVAVVRKGVLNGDIGETVRLNGATFVIIGIVDPEFRGLTLDSVPDVFVPFPGDPARGSVAAGPVLPFVPKGGFLSIVARIPIANRRSIVSQETLTTLSQAPKTRFRESSRNPPHWLGAEIAVLPQEIRASIGKTLLFLGITVVVLQILGVVNVSTLAGLRMLNYRREIAVCLALGASWTQLATQLGRRWAVVGSAAGAFGAILAGFCLRGLETIRVSQLVSLFPRTQVDLAVAVPLVILLSVLPTAIMALWLWVISKSEADLTRAPGLTPSGRQLLSLHGLILVQVALALGLFGPAALVAHRFSEHAWPTTLPDVTYVPLDMDLSGYAQAELSHRVDAARVALERLPSVAAVSLTTALPLGARFVYPVETFGLRPEAHHTLSTYFVGTGYFQALGMPLTGTPFRQVSKRDGAIVNERAASLFWGTQNVLGKVIRIGGGIGELPVVGVVADNAPGLYAAHDARLYLPLGPIESPVLFAIVRGEATKQQIREALRQAAPDLPAGQLLSLRDNVALYWGRARLLATAAAVAGIMAALLALWGVYVTTRYAVSLRSAEIAIRIAVGASPALVVFEVGSRVAKWCLPGLTLGLLLSAQITVLLRGAFFPELTSESVLSLVGPVAVLSVAVMAALLAPVVRAAYRQPVDALLRNNS